MADSQRPARASTIRYDYKKLNSQSKEIAIIDPKATKSNASASPSTNADANADDTIDPTADSTTIIQPNAEYAGIDEYNTDLDTDFEASDEILAQHTQPILCEPPSSDITLSDSVSQAQSSATAAKARSWVYEYFDSTPQSG
jgi:hypothetical protein